jgi:glucose/arabinose dehydrogenase
MRETIFHAPEKAGKSHRLTTAAAAMAVLVFVAAPLHGQQTFRAADHSYRVVNVAEGLANPWGLAFLPGGDMLVTERPGRLRLIRNGQLQPNPIQGVPDVRARGQGGLLDVAIHPDFAQNRLVYLSYSKANAAGDGTTAIVRGTLDGDRLTNVEEIFEARAWSGTNGHYGSRIVFNDGYIFFTVGDRQATPVAASSHPAQDLGNHQGTVIRLHDDGRVPSDNPFVGRAGALPEIWAYGIRSPQGLTLHPESGELWESEHGPRGGDEINVIRAGSNYGWPIITYGINYNGQPITDITEREGLEQPLHNWVPSIATSGLAIYHGDAFPAWRGSTLVGGLTGQYLSRIPFTGHQPGAEEKLLEGFGERIRDVRVGPDGLIYVLTDNADGRILRLEPS